MMPNNSLDEIDKIEGGDFFPPQFFLGNPTKVYGIPVVGWDSGGRRRSESQNVRTNPGLSVKLTYSNAQC